MGGKRVRKRKYLFIYIACAIAVYFVFPSCTRVPLHIMEDFNFRNADALMKNGQYAAALAENKRIFAEGPVALKDRALYRIALIYARNENNPRDLLNAREYFTEIVKNYPESFLSSRAKSWIQLINKLESSQKEISDLNADKTNLNTEKSNLDAEKTNLSAENNILKEDIKKREKKINLLEKKIDELEAQIENLKQIDLGLEQKKSRGVP